MTDSHATMASPHVRAKRHRRRGEILRAALDAFRARGYHQATLDDIADRVGVRKSALYHYFPDKESILYECHRMSLAELHRVIRDAEARFDRADEQLRYAIREHVRVMTETLEGSPSAFEVTALRPDHQHEIIAGRDAYERRLRRIVQRGSTAGVFRATDPKVVTFAILGAINWVARWYRPEGVLRSREVGDQFADYLVGGLTCP